MRPAEWALPSKKSVRTQSMRNAGMLLEQCLCVIVSVLAECLLAAICLRGSRTAGEVLGECFRNACVLLA